MTSRMLGLFVSSMTSRSTPSPMPAGRRHAVLQRGDEILVELDGIQLRLVLRQRLFPLRLRRRARRLLRLSVGLDLSLQTLALIDGIGELAEGVGQLAARR